MSRAVLVLSGGRSRRMKQDKSQLMYQGHTLVDWQVSRFQAKNFQVVSQLVDRYPGYLGPLAGIDSALNQFNHINHWVIVPVDMPKLPVDYVERLFSEGLSRKMPVAFENAPMPLYIENTKPVRATLTQWLENPNGKRSVYALITELNGCWLPATASAQELENYNTPEEWQHALSEV